MSEEEGILSDRELEEGVFKFKSEVALGVEAESFLNSKLAHHIKVEAQVKVDEAYEMLATADPEDHKRIRELQSVIKQFKHFNEVLIGIVMAGNEAYRVLQTELQDN